MSVILVCSMQYIKDIMETVSISSNLILGLVYFNNIIIHISFKKLPSQSIYHTVFFSLC